MTALKPAAQGLFRVDSALLHVMPRRCRLALLLGKSRRAP